MSFDNYPNGLTPSEYAALVDAAKARAIELRREAIREFWSAAGLKLQAAWRAIRHHTPRLHLRARSEA